MQQHQSRDFEIHYTTLKTKLNAAIERVITEFPGLNASQLRAYIHKHLCGIVRIDIAQFAGIKVLPLFDSQEANQFLTRHPALKQFLINTGLFIGGINARRYLINAISTRLDTQLAGGGGSAVIR